MSFQKDFDALLKVCVRESFQADFEGYFKEIKDDSRCGKINFIYHGQTSLGGAITYGHTYTHILYNIWVTK